MTLEPAARRARPGAGPARQRVGALALAPFVTDGGWRGLLVLAKPEPYAWHEDECDLLRELAARVWLRVERARAEERFRRAADAASALVYEVDLVSGRIEAYGLEHIVGPGADEELTRDRWCARLHPDDLDAHRAGLERCLADPRCDSYRGSYRVLHADGRYRDVEDVARVVRARGDARPLRLVGTILDVTSRVQADLALRAADRRKDEFLAVLSHELRNPLAPIRTSLELLDVLAPADPARAEARAVLERQFRHLVRLVDDLLDVSRISRGKIDLRHGNVDLAGVVRQAVETCRPQIDARGHRLAVRLPSEPVYVRGDSTRLAQVVGNLLVNSAKYTDEGGNIELALERGGTRQQLEARLRVRDDGRGIAPDALPHVFDLFFQAERDLDRSQGGLGLGLSLVKSLVELHGGRVEAHSAGRGQGSEFVVVLPALARAGPVAAHGVPPPARVQRPLRILVVDDDRDAAHGLARVLNLDGHHVACAQDGRRALELARAAPPEVVLLDLGLPRMDGHRVCRALRDGGLTDALVVAVTGYGQEEDRRASRDAGFDAHLLKPLDLEHLRDLLAERAARP